ncbi:MAG: hypothetical protein ABJD24_02060 [Acidimicrobiales bacterium]
MVATYDTVAKKTNGYMIAKADGTVEPHGKALWLGDMRDTALVQPIVAIAETPSQAGYWLAASDGGIFNFGDAAFLGSMGGQKLNSPIVAMASTKSGKGYWLFAADGGVFAFGDAAFYGSMGGRAMNAPIVDAAAAPGGGYYLLGADGGVFRFGNAFVNFSMADVDTGAPYAALAVTSDGSGVRIVDSKGNKGHSAGAFDLIRDEPLPPASPVVDMVTNPVPGINAGFYFVQADGGVYTFDGVPFLPTQNDEERLLKSNRQPIEQIIAAAGAGDLAQARNASQTWDVIWHGVEVYLNFRSTAHYAKLEGDIQGRMNTELAKPAPDLALVKSIAQELLVEYDVVIDLCSPGGLSPIFVDLAAARFDRALIAQGVTQDLNANQLGEAKAWWTQFKLHFAAANALIAGRSANAAAETAAAVAAVDAVINTATVDALKPLVATANTKFGVGVSLLNAAARNAVPGKTAITFDDQIMVIGLNNIKISLSKANAAWKAGNYTTALAWANTAAGPQFDLVQPTLASKLANDNPLRTALNSFKALTGAAGPATAFDTAYTAAVNATNNAQQVIAGQFWLVPAVQKFVASLPTS